jgi:hypothetical protein
MAAKGVGSEGRSPTCGCWLIVRQRVSETVNAPDDGLLQLLEELRPRLPQRLRTFFRNPESVDTAATVRFAHKQVLRSMQRWWTIQNRVGWLGIAMSHGFKASILDHGSDPAFRNLVDTLVNQRHVMTEILELAWPNFPPLLLLVGGTSLNMREAYLPGEAGVGSIQAFMQLPNHERVSANRADENVTVPELQGDSDPPSDDNVTVVQGANGADDNVAELGVQGSIQVQPPSHERVSENVLQGDSLMPDIQVPSTTPPALTSTGSVPELEMPDIQVAPTAVTLTSTSSVSIQSLPTWEWAKNSCSLDATLHVALRICETLPNHVSHCVDSADESFQTLYSHYLQLQGLRTRRKMTKARDAVRVSLGDGQPPLIISGKSTLDGPLMRLIPASLRNLTICHTYKCENKTCIDKVNSGAEEFEGGQRRDVNPDYLIYPANFQKNSNTQMLLKKVVRNPPSPR